MIPGFFLLPTVKRDSEREGNILLERESEREE